MEPCQLCEEAFTPEHIQPGVWKLYMVKGYTIDLRLRELRKLTRGKAIQFIPFASRKGQKILQQLHEQRLMLSEM